MFKDKEKTRKLLRRIKIRVKCKLAKDNYNQKAS